MPPGVCCAADITRCGTAGATENAGSSAAAGRVVWSSRGSCQLLSYVDFLQIDVASFLDELAYSLKKIALLHI